MKMNLPNKLTCLRVILIPFFVIFMMLSDTGSFSISSDALNGLSEMSKLYSRIDDTAQGVDSFDIDVQGSTAEDSMELIGQASAGIAASGGFKADVSVIGGADGPTSIFVAGKGAGLEFGVDMSMRIIACIIFCAASFTDFLDGYLARKNNLVTNFGKFMDPLADKLLVCSALILITVYSPYVPVWVTLIIIAREFIISGFRLVASDNGIVIAASKWGKLKTVSQMALCIIGILNIPGLTQYGAMIFNILVAVVLMLTLISLFDYIYKNKEVLTRGGM